MLPALCPALEISLFLLGPCDQWANADLVHELEIGVAGVGPELDGDFDSGDQGGFVAEGALEAAARPPAIGRPEFLRLMLFLKN